MYSHLLSPTAFHLVQNHHPVPHYAASFTILLYRRALTMLVSLLLGSMLAYLVWYIFCLEANVRTARALKVPVVRIPFDVNSNLWVVVQPLLWKILAHLPILWNSYPDFIRFSHRNWHFLEKSSPTVCYGPVWALVSPRGVHLHFSDPDAIQEIFSRWRDFVRPVKKYRKFIIPSFWAQFDP